ncbi:MAG: metallophosphoesterase family protein [Pseudomonadota bacterium]
MPKPRSAADAPRRLGIIGDVHAEDAALAQAIEHLVTAGVDALLCTGDIADGPGDIERCCALLQEHGVLTVAGNHERWLLNDRVRHIPHAHDRRTLSDSCLEYLAALPKTLEINTVAGPLMLCHGIGEYDMVKVWPGSERLGPQRSEHMDALLEEGAYRWLINGHMHYRTLIHFQSLTFMNAGTLSRRHRPGITLLDFEADTVSAFEFAESGMHHQLTRPLTPYPEEPVWRNTEAFTGASPPIVLYQDQGT